MALEDIRGKRTQPRARRKAAPPDKELVPLGTAEGKHPDAPRAGWTRWTVHARELYVTKLKELSARTGQSLAELVDAALAAFLARVEAEHGTIRPPERERMAPLDLKTFRAPKK